MSWYSFMNLLDLDVAEGFLCSKCGLFPTVISCDATTLGFRREYAQRLQITHGNMQEGHLLGKQVSFFLYINN